MAVTKTWYKFVFAGVGYMKLLSSFIATVWTVIHTAVAGGYLLNTLRSSIPFDECTLWNETSVCTAIIYNLKINIFILYSKQKNFISDWFRE